MNPSLIQKRKIQHTGHLRNALSDPNDAIAIITDPNGTSKGAYIALALVTISELDDIVNQFNE